MLQKYKPAILVLETGEYFIGQAIGQASIALGELIFNTSMTGYQEILTDPSYYQQIINFTATHIGNVGFNSEDYESNRVWAAGIIVQEASEIASNWRSEGNFRQFLSKHGVVAIAGLDTRYLTQIIRSHGALKACITTDVAAESNIKKYAEIAKKFSQAQQTNLADKVSTSIIYQWPINLVSAKEVKPYHVVVVDLGVKRSILNKLASFACVSVVPARTGIKELLSLQPDGIVLSNGPGDPQAYAELLPKFNSLAVSGIPMLGICLGYQLLCLAIGAKTFKMPFGQHGSNHPVKVIETSNVWITAQNHSYAVDELSLPADLLATHYSLFDGSLQGVRHKRFPVLGFQGHPEAAPGPVDANSIFEDFFAEIKLYNKAKVELI